MPKFLIERDIPGAANLTADQLRGIAEKSVCAMKHLPEYIWHESYVVGDRIFCVHEAPDAEAIREHSRRGGFPVTSVTEIAATFSPAILNPAESAA